VQLFIDCGSEFVCWFFFSFGCGNLRLCTTTTSSLVYRLLFVFWLMYAFAGWVWGLPQVDRNIGFLISAANCMLELFILLVVGMKPLVHNNFQSLVL
jgi:hypothetical protein